MCAKSPHGINSLSTTIPASPILGYQIGRSLGSGPKAPTPFAIPTGHRCHLTNFGRLALGSAFTTGCDDVARVRWACPHDALALRKHTIEPFRPPGRHSRALPVAMGTPRARRVGKGPKRDAQTSSAVRSSALGAWAGLVLKVAGFGGRRL